MLSQSFYFIIDLGISALVHDKEVVYCLKTTDKWFLFQSMSTVELPGAEWYVTKFLMHSITSTPSVSLAQ